jgi:hypothetical protein
MDADTNEPLPAAPAGPSLLPSAAELRRRDAQWAEDEAAVWSDDAGRQARRSSTVRITFEVNPLDLDALKAAGLNDPTISQLLLCQRARGEAFDLNRAFNDQLAAKTFLRRLMVGPWL